MTFIPSFPLILTKKQIKPLNEANIKKTTAKLLKNFLAHEKKRHTKQKVYLSGSDNYLSTSDNYLSGSDNYLTLSDKLFVLAGRFFQQGKYFFQAY